MLPRVGKPGYHLKQIDWNKFTITDNLLFQRVMRDKKLCKYLIEHILNIRIRDIQYLETEKTLSGQLGKKGIRLDVYLEDEQGSVLRKNGLNEFVRLTRAFCEWQGNGLKA